MTLRRSCAKRMLRRSKRLSEMTAESPTQMLVQGAIKLGVFWTDVFQVLPDFPCKNYIGEGMKWVLNDDRLRASQAQANTILRQNRRLAKVNVMQIELNWLSNRNLANEELNESDNPMNRLIIALKCQKCPCETQTVAAYYTSYLLTTS